MRDSPCAECGAPLESGRSCRDYFHALLALEAEVSRGEGGRTTVGSVGRELHFFAVASYNLQHPSEFVPGALVGLHRTVADVLARRATTADALRRARFGASGATQVRRRPDTHVSASDQALLERWPTRWPFTVRDTLAGGVSDYAEHVRAWASAVVAALDPIATPRPTDRG